MKDSTQQPNDKHSVVKPEKSEELHQADHDHDGLTPLGPQLMPKMPMKGAGNLRRAAVLQMQRQQGNGFVQRYLANRGGDSVQRLPDIQTQDEDHSGTSTEISDGSASVKTQGGIVKASGSIIELDAPMIRTSGIIRAGSIVVDSVVASSYTPGAGNIM